MRSHLALAFLGCLALAGCQKQRAGTGGTSDADFFEEQVETWRRQSNQADRLMDEQEAQSIRYERLLEAMERNEERNEKLLSKWEEQAQRMDAILTAKEKEAGVEPPPPARDSESAAKEDDAEKEPDATRGIVSEVDMIRVLSGRLSVGTPLETARAFMEAQGFKCSLITHGQFGDRQGIDYLYCRRSDDSGMALVDRRWQVAIILGDGKVVEIDASTGLVGL